MLTSLPPLSPQPHPWLPGSSPLPPRLKRRACPERKRGGQPGNANARRHGLYSTSAPHPHAALFRSLRKPLDCSAQLQAALPGWIAALNGIVVENRLKLREIIALTAHNLPFADLCTWLRATAIIIGKQVKVVKALHELGGRQAHLRRLVRELPALLNWEFARRGIPAQPIFVPQELNNFHANLDWRFPRLTAAQWWLLQETFVSLHVELDSFRKYRRRKPLPADRILLEGILYKLASGLRWQDLRANYPVRLCQDLYRALYRSGRMQAIYEQLHSHLNVYGEATLDELVERGCFVITGNRVHLSPSEELTWEKYTALLLLQQAFHARRAIQRETDLERRRRGIFYRLPSLRLPSSACSLLMGHRAPASPQTSAKESNGRTLRPPIYSCNLNSDYFFKMI